VPAAGAVRLDQAALYRISIRENGIILFSQKIQIVLLYSLLLGHVFEWKVFVAAAAGGRT
jgi:hypothetical protein